MLCFAHQTPYYRLRRSFPHVLEVLAAEGSQLFLVLGIALYRKELPHSSFGTILGAIYIKILMNWRTQTPNFLPSIGTTLKSQLTSRTDVSVVFYSSSTPPLPISLLPLLLC